MAADTAAAEATAFEQYCEGLREEGAQTMPENFECFIAQLIKCGYLSNIGTAIETAAATAWTKTTTAHDDNDDGDSDISDDDDDDEDGHYDGNVILHTVRSVAGQISKVWHDRTYNPPEDDRRHAKQCMQIMYMLEKGGKWPAGLPDRPDREHLHTLLAYRNRFGYALRDAALKCIAEGNNMPVRLLVVIFGRAVFDTQARAFPGPAHLHPTAAFRDARGETDLFSGLFEEYLNRTLQQFLQVTS